MTHPSLFLNMNKSTYVYAYLLDGVLALCTYICSLLQHQDLQGPQFVAAIFYNMRCLKDSVS